MFALARVSSFQINLKSVGVNKIGSSSNGMKLSSNTLLYQGFACLSAWSGSPHASWG
jgi:hypothetical protein